MVNELFARQRRRCYRAMCQRRTCYRAMCVVLPCLNLRKNALDAAGCLLNCAELLAACVPLVPQCAKKKLPQIAALLLSLFALLVVAEDTTDLLMALSLPTPSASDSCVQFSCFSFLLCGTQGQRVQRSGRGRHARHAHERRRQRWYYRKVCARVEVSS